MSGNTFAVVFSGQLVDGANEEQVKTNFAQLFKVDMGRVAPMFSGAPVTIKKGVDEATARKYQQALQQAGAICQLVDMAAPEPVAQATPSAGALNPQSPAPSAAPSVTALNATLAEPGALLKEPEMVEPLQIETSHLSMGEAGERLVEPAAIPEPQIDVSMLSMAEPGVQLVEPGTIEAPEIDVSTLSMAEPGAVLQEPEAIEAPKIDTSGISLA